MITRALTIQELKQIYVETFINKTDKVTKVSDESVMNGVSYGVAKIAQKAMKDVTLIESHLFPDAAFGIHLDTVADKLGVAARFGASQSMTYVRVSADAGTTYTAGTNVFKGSGQSFDIVEDFTVGSEGYGYIKVRSQQSGSESNVESLTINSVNPSPAGHQFVTNEYRATGGRVQESDEVFRIRIKKGANIGAVDTLERLTQVAIKFNNDVLEVTNYGVNSQNQNVLGIVTQNGMDLTAAELSQLRDDMKTYLSLHDYNNVTTASIGVELINIEYEPIDIEFRCNLIQNAQVDEIRKDIQVEIAKYFDYRHNGNRRRIEWDDLLQIVKENSGIEYVPDSYFIPQSDTDIRTERLPRVRGFKMLDLDGNLIIDNSNVLNPIYYPNTINESLQTIL